jgi:hypothetical protein
MTYGVNAPLGLQPSSYLISAPWTGGFQEFPITAAYATSLFTGDFVTLSGGYLVRYAAGGGAANPPLGVFIGCKYLDASGVYQFPKYWQASTVIQAGSTAYGYVITDPNTEWNIQSTGVAVTQANLDFNADISFATAGSTATGLSGMALDAGTIAATDTLPLRIIAFTPQPGNVAGVQYNNVLVRLNQTVYRDGQIGV